MTGGPLVSGDPAQVGPYELVSRLGEGGMGVVYLAIGTGGRRVALKVIRPQLASHEAFLERFRLEVALARKVARFCTAPILDSDTGADPPYIVTEYVHGPTLSSAVAEHGPLAGSELHSLAVGVASALSAIHRAGVIHRDLKPSNVLLSRYGPRVIDFGIAKAVDAISDITQTGEMVGSPSYMSPERFRGDAITPASDVFSWGSVLAYAGTGRPPFGTSNEAVYYRILHGDPDLDGLDPDLAELAEWALRKDPAERPSAQQLLDALLEESGSSPGARVAARATLPAPTVDPDAHTMAEVTAPPHPPPPARRRPGRLTAAVVALAIVLAGTAGGAAWLTASDADGSGGGEPSAALTTAPVPAGYPAVVKDDAATGPAKPVPGARRGGTVRGLNDDSLQGLDPQRDYGADTMSLSSALLFRSLTGYVQDGRALRLVGDLATSTGVPSQNGSVWEYTLRDGLFFEDGTPIRAADVAYGVARSFDENLDGGPNYIQNWLYGTKGLGFLKQWQPAPGKLPRGLDVIGEKKLRFTFVDPHPEFPMVAALGTTTPVPQGKDTGRNYGGAPVSSGPYKIGPGRGRYRLELVRNDKWRPGSDPIRHDYPDKFVFEDQLTEADASLRVLAAQGTDQAAFTWNNVDPSLLDEAERSASDRTLHAPSPRMKYLAINTRNVPDLAVRQAIVAAIDRIAALETFGGRSYGTETTTLQSSVMPGYRRHTALGVGTHGDPGKAKKLLAGRQPQLTYIYRDYPKAPRERKLAKAIEKALEAVGFTVILKAYDGSELNLLKEIGRRDNKYDLYSFVWTPDVPDGAGMFDLWSRWTITDTDNKNVSYMKDPWVEGQIGTLSAEPDRSKAAAGYAALDEQIIIRDAPMVPLFERTRNTLYGPKLRGLFINRTFGAVSLVNVHVLP